MRKIIYLGLSSVVLLLGVALPVTAEVYRWVDSAGKTHYGDRAPQEPRNKATRININVEAATVDPEAERARQQLRSIETGRQRERTFEAQKAAQEQERQQDLAQRCGELQNDIRQDREVAVFYRYDDKGNRVLWTSEERLAYRANLQNLRQSYCPGLPE